MMRLRLVRIDRLLQAALPCPNDAAHHAAAGATEAGTLGRRGCSSLRCCSNRHLQRQLQRTQPRATLAPDAESEATSIIPPRLPEPQLQLASGRGRRRRGNGLTTTNCAAVAAAATAPSAATALEATRRLCQRRLTQLLRACSNNGKQLLHPNLPKASAAAQRSKPSDVGGAAATAPPATATVCQWRFISGRQSPRYLLKAVCEPWVCLVQ